VEEMDEEIKPGGQIARICQHLFNNVDMYQIFKTNREIERSAGEDIVFFIGGETEIINRNEYSLVMFNLGKMHGAAEAEKERNKL
jgi:hypothetical protein